ncbi:RNA methyltransferase [Hyphomonas johnsonii]|jgi:tRNA/rRNA methyltransferase|uniref:tRNA/rRNA methyltransferase SpoU n=1 Tax=Hyphomonas johnsonii MHS-2 TaxID=1280950 RepID=A0A059FUG7_9PROT|nr:TrmH family RNA methyltransferase [Hyphomonas johnsonii]KCZ94319.1 tRNA/rRNA methyltransferase SpoU [Hyphomonas johnsonii MHS-2]
MSEQRSPCVILHSPQLGENIGAAARVMRNFGLTDLRLVAPRDGWPNPAAETMSAGAFEADVTVNVYETLQDALEDVTFLIAATARLRGIEKRVTDAVGAAEAAHGRALGGGKGVAGVMFGGEKAGLPNEAVALSDLLMTYPVDPAFKSLNLAQAVCVFAHEWGKLAIGARETGSESGTGLGAPASRQDLVRMFEHFEGELERAGYFFPPEKTPLMKDNLRAALIRADWTEQEVQTFRGAIKALAIGRGKARVMRED